MQVILTINCIEYSPTIVQICKEVGSAMVAQELENAPSYNQSSKECSSSTTLKTSKGEAKYLKVKYDLGELSPDEKL